MVKRIIKKIKREWDILNVRWIVKHSPFEFMNGEFYVPGGIPFPGILAESLEEKQKRWEQEMEGRSEYYRTHGYEKGSQMDIWTKKYGYLNNVVIDRGFSLNPFLGKVLK